MIVRAMGEEESCETLTSEHDTMVAHINAQPLWLPVEGLHKDRPLNVPAWIRKGAPELPVREAVYS